LNVEEALQQAIYFKKRQSRFGHSYYNILTHNALILVLDGWRSLRSDITLKTKLDTAKLDLFQQWLKKR
jgi:hypothetical protein